MTIISPSYFCFTGSSFPIKPLSLCLLLGVTMESLLLLFCCFPNFFWFILYIPCSLVVCLFCTLEHGIPSNNLCRASSAGITALNSLLLCNFFSLLLLRLVVSLGTVVCAVLWALYNLENISPSYGRFQSFCWKFRCTLEAEACESLSFGPVSYRLLLPGMSG